MKEAMTFHEALSEIRKLAYELDVPELSDDEKMKKIKQAQKLIAYSRKLIKDNKVEAHKGEAGT